MATTKKTTAKKAPAKKTAAKAPVKKVSTKKTTQSAPRKQSQIRSFQVAQNDPPFTTFKISRQTVYWVILVGFIIFAQLWILKLQIDVSILLDAQQAQIDKL